MTFLPVDASTATAATKPSMASLQLITSGAATAKDTIHCAEHGPAATGSTCAAAAHIQHTCTLEPHGVDDSHVSSEHFGVRIRLLALEEVICLALLWPKILSPRVSVLWEVGPHRLLNFLQTPLGQVSICVLICSGF